MPMRQRGMRRRQSPDFGTQIRRTPYIAVAFALAAGVILGRLTS